MRKAKSEALQQEIAAYITELNEVEATASPRLISDKGDGTPLYNSRRDTPKNGLSVRKVASRFGISLSAAQRYLVKIRGPCAK